MPNLSALRNTLRLSDAALQLVRNAVPAAERIAKSFPDPSTWSREPDVQSKIANRLGWLYSPTAMAGTADRLRDFAEGVRRDGFTDVVLLGMGGSSLAPEVLRSIVGVAAGWPRFHMVDSTDPDGVRAVATAPDRKSVV